ncbi:MAG: Fe-S cluster assembly protein HesB [Deltaproteobacteria bacterium]|nr:Fe-S cluster assembly protein HesB [Deltaproteobacteria bacterium]MBW1978403.1 Fe-S cluster assembly protein HesB [Deltaproteobacteria bacterium]MBW2300906.1 Fe-S cluster assembly protein HesB [Deltaproteobacteria bacterium]
MNEDGITYLVNKELFEMVKPVRVDFVESVYGSGFSISSNLNTGAGCGSCSSC